MALCIRRYLVRKEVSAPYVESYQKLERRLNGRAQSLQLGKDGVTAGNFAERYQELVNEFNADADEIFLSFVREKGIADALDSRDGEPLAFDNFFKWSIGFRVPGDRLLMEVRAISEKWFPIKQKPSCMRELNDDEFWIMSGGQRDFAASAQSLAE